MDIVSINKEDLATLLDGFLCELETGVYEYSSPSTLEDLDFARRMDELASTEFHERIYDLDRYRVSEARRRNS